MSVEWLVCSLVVASMYAGLCTAKETLKIGSRSSQTIKYLGVRFDTTYLMARVLHRKNHRTAYVEEECGKLLWTGARFY